MAVFLVRLDSCPFKTLSFTKVLAIRITVPPSSTDFRGKRGPKNTDSNMCISEHNGYCVKY